MRFQADLAENNTMINSKQIPRARFCPGTIRGITKGGVPEVIYFTKSTFNVNIKQFSAAI
jgi:hypothetical protein